MTVNAQTAPATNATTADSPYQWLLFDADGTLFDYDRAESAALCQAFGQIGVPFKPAYISTYRTINQALWKEVEAGAITPGMVNERRFKLLLEAIRVEHSPAALGTKYLRCLSGCSELVEEAEAVLQVLGKKYRIAILTNGLKEVQRGRLAASAIRHHISELVISEEVGFAKPAKGYFDAAFARLGHPAKSDVLMIGDSWPSDILGAVQYGLDACWYNPARKPRPAAPAITREIASLRDLLAWL